MTRRETDETAPRKSHKVVWIIVILVVVVLAIVFFMSRSKQAAAATAKAGADAAKRAVPVSSAVVKQQDVPVFLEGLGNVQAFSTVTVKTRVDGQLIRFNFQEGQQVHQGEELALIDPRPFEAVLTQAQATRFRDQAQLENGRRDLQRFADLYKDGVIPQQQYDAQKSLVGQNEGSVRADDAQIQSAQLNVTYCHVLSPINGTVGLRLVDAGNMVHASDQNGLIVITQLQPIAVLFTLPEDNLPTVAQHMKAGTLSVEAWSRDDSQKLTTGRLLTVDNQIDPNTGTVRLKAVFDNRDGMLFPNQFVNARLQVEVRKQAMIIPAAALQHGADGTYVYLIKPDKSVEARPITEAFSQGTLVVIDKGLQPGDQVVTDGADKLQPGSKVEPAGAGGGAGKGKGQKGKAAPADQGIGSAT